MFGRLAIMETYQLDTVRTLLLHITDPTAGQATGTFSDGAAQATALAAGLTGLTAPDVWQLYTELLGAAEMYQGLFAQDGQ
jgi:hypothetical protein